jgi:queuine/archaeosine tRNA-ribosyltransferase
MRATPRVWLGQSADTSSLCAGYPDLQNAPFLTSLGCAIRRPSLKDTHFNSGLKAKLGISGPLMIDSGGFALIKAPSSIWSARTVGNLIERIEADVFVSLDLPPTPQDDQQCRRRKILSSTRNFKYLTSRFPSKSIMPVVHGRTLSEISYSIEQLLKHRAPTWVGLGGIVPLLQNRFGSNEIAKIGPEAFIGHSIRKIRVAFPLARIHAFGAGGTRTFPAVFAFGADSADSIGWRQAAGFGSVFLPLKSQRLVSWNRTSRPPRKMLDEADLEQLRECACPICGRRPSLSARLSALRQGFHNRAIHNAWTLCNQYRHWPHSRSAMVEAVARGTLGFRWAAAMR